MLEAMMGVSGGSGETFTGYTFRPDDDASIHPEHALRYATVSHTALNFPSLRKSMTNGQCRNTGHWGRSTCPPSLTSPRFLRLLLWSSWRKLATMERPKLYSLIALVIQSSLLALTVRYSRTESVEGVRYLSSTAVVMSEVIKVIVCIIVMVSTARKAVLSQLAVITNSRDIIKSCVPAILYTLQNNLQFVAMNYLDAATFQVTYQLKILSTAVFSVCFLRHRLDIIHWSALVMLTFGVAMVQFPKSVECGSNSEVPCEVMEGHTNTSFLGVSCVLAMCVSSGFAGVYTEKILKSTNSVESLWAKNLQLACTSVVVSLVCVVVQDGEALATGGFFQGYNVLTWVVILQQAILGLVISLVMKYADNILKGFASSIGILITTIVSSLVLNDLQLSCSFLVGASVVMGSALLYNVDRNIDIYNPESVI